MPKDAKKNVDRYKIRGGDLNEYEFHQNQGQVNEAFGAGKGAAAKQAARPGNEAMTKQPAAKAVKGATAKKAAANKSMAKKSATKKAATKKATKKAVKKAAKKRRVARKTTTKK